MTIYCDSSNEEDRKEGEEALRTIALLLEEDNKIEKMQNLLDDKLDILTDTMLDGFDRIYDKILEK